MLRKLLIVGAFAGSAASVPVIYQSNPELFNSAISGSPETQAEVQPRKPKLYSNAVQPARTTLSGRRHLIDADNQGHFRDEFKLNGRRVQALVDTGATLIAINQSTARRIGIKLTRSDFVHEVNTANGATKAAVTKIEHVDVGRIRVKDVPAVVLEDSALQGTLVGMSFLKELSSFKVEDGKLLLEE